MAVSFQSLDDLGFLHSDRAFCLFRLCRCYWSICIVLRITIERYPKQFFPSFQESFILLGPWLSLNNYTRHHLAFLV